MMHRHTVPREHDSTNDPCQPVHMHTIIYKPIILTLADPKDLEVQKVFTSDVEPMQWVVSPPGPLVGREEGVLQYPIGVERHTMVGVATHLLQQLGVACPALHHHVVSPRRITTLDQREKKNILHESLEDLPFTFNPKNCGEMPAQGIHLRPY